MSELVTFKWISCEECFPDKDTREQATILWWHRDEECAFSGNYECYDGRRLWVGVRGEFQFAIPIRDFSHWMALPPPNLESESVSEAIEEK